ncbi:MAG TPA: TIGR03435 family protein [Terracidiphilus sp.]|nr:TIGR03435 family protein [Terracidiphilus sp.]
MPSDPRFMVATIKPSDPNRTDNDMGLSPGGLFDAKSQSLKQLIEFVEDFGYYGVDQRIIGGPKWVSSAKFDIEAKCDEATSLAFRKMSLKKQIRAEQDMVQALLAERFHLRTHHEMRPFRVYALAQARGGSKMKASRLATRDEPGSPVGPPGNWTGDGVTMEELASNLSALPEVGGRIVVDKTGLQGRFDFALKWTPDPELGALRSAPDNGLDDSSALSLLTAMREQLGLKLEMTKAPVDVIVIDSAEWPTPN